MSPYAGSQPSIVRTILTSLPDYSAHTFVDVGCGKGRPLIVASEFPFANIIGVEISASLVAVARANARTIADRYPERPRINVRIADATTMSPLAPHVVFFMYHPFDGTLVRALVENIALQLRSGLTHAFFIYYNPVHGQLFDRAPHLTRWSAEMLPYAPSELGYGPDREDAVVTWQTTPGRYPARPGASREIIVDQSGWHTRLR